MTTAQRLVRIGRHCRQISFVIQFTAPCGIPAHQDQQARAGFQEVFTLLEVLISKPQLPRGVARADENNRSLNFGRFPHDRDGGAADLFDVVLEFEGGEPCQ